MRLVPLAGAAGGELARDIRSPRAGAPPLLRRGAVVQDAHLRPLADAGIRTAWVHDELADGVEPRLAVPDEVRVEAEHVVAQARADAREALAGGRLLADAAVVRVCAAAELLVGALAEDVRALVPLVERASPAAHAGRHPVDAAVTGLLVGRAHMRREGWTDWRTGRHTRGEGIDDRLVRLAAGLLLQDVGMAVLPAEAAARTGPLDDTERALMRTHPEEGVRLLGASGLPSAVLAVVGGHHERFDGSGYPARTRGAAIHVLARVAAVADVHAAVTADRPYAQAGPPAAGVEAVRAGAGSAFDPAVAATFAQVVMPFPVGTALRLPDGREAVVAAVDPHDAHALVVRVALDGGGVGEEAVVLPAAPATRLPSPA